MRSRVERGRVTVSAPGATGTRTTRDGMEWVLLTRRVQASTRAVWVALTDPDAVARWAGTASRRPGPGRGVFDFTFTGDVLLPVAVRVEHVDPGRAIAVSVAQAPAAGGRLILEIELSADPGGATVLRAAQSVPSRVFAPSVAAGCEFFVDRLVALLEGRDVSAVGYDEYFVAQADHYRAIFPLPERPT
jgi:uncharacterized protein YndB with AHSA1/START domain